MAKKSINILDKDYTRWVKELSSCYRKSQIKAAVRVNSEMLRYYWELGRDIMERDAENKYGSNFYGMLSADLKKSIPNLEGLSPSNIRYSKRFFQLYSSIIENLQQVAEKLEQRFFQQVAEKSLTPLEWLESTLFSVPWGHHMLLVDKCSENPQKALFFARQTVENGWSRTSLLNALSSDLYERQGKALTNFERTLPAETSDLAQELTKDPYDFAFTGLAQPNLLLPVNALPAVAYIGDGAHDEECGQQVESEDFCAHEDGGEERVRCSAKDSRIPESCRKREGNPHDGRDGCAEGCADGK